MIGSHNSLTYLKSTSWVCNRTTKWWRTQCKSIYEQYAFGVRFFDFRVCRDGNQWRLCHGEANLKMTFSRLKNICNLMGMKYPDAIYRIVLEKGDDDLFKRDALHPLRRMVSQDLCDRYENLWRVDIKSTGNWMGSVCNNNQNLYDRGYKFAKVDTWTPPAHELHGSITASNFYKTNLKKEAQKINGSLQFFKDPQLLKDMIGSKDELFFLDYCTNQY